MTPRRSALAPLAALACAGLVSACGQSTLTTGELRADAARICATTQRLTALIPTPTAPGQSAGFVDHGIAALGPELVDLRRLRAPIDESGEYRSAVAALAGELDAMRDSVRGLRAGDDAVLAIRTLQTRLTPLELRGGRAWDEVGLPACASA